MTTTDAILGMLAALIIVPIIAIGLVSMGGIITPALMFIGGAAFFIVGIGISLAVLWLVVRVIRHAWGR